MSHRTQMTARFPRIPMTARALSLGICWFPTGMPKGPAYGDPEYITWPEFAGAFSDRREGEKDGPNFVAARFKLELDGRVRRLKANLLARTALVLDIETNKQTGEIPPSLDAAGARVLAERQAAVIYTSHNHTPEAPRYRIVLPISEEIDPDLPAVEVVADRLQLAGVLDTSKLVASSLFYLPSASPGELGRHYTEVIDGNPIDAAWIRETAGTLLSQRQAEADRIATEAHAQAAARRHAKIAAGFDPDDGLIEKLRAHFDLAGVLQAHGYDKAGTKFRHPNSTSGSYGADIKTFGGIERVFTHNATDPLHASNLPDWCGGVTALDAIDAIIVLDFGGNRTKALAALAERFGLNKAEERKAVAALLFRLIRQQAAQEDMEAAAYTEGVRLGLSHAEVIQVAQWVASQATNRKAA
jgi:hypothetical protein